MKVRLPPIVCGLLAACSVSSAADFHIAPNGSDGNPGTQAEPFRTLEGARDAIRKLKSGMRQPAGGVTVWLRGGVYRIARTFELDELDSGTKEAPVVYRACKDEQVILSGGRELDPAVFTPVHDPAVLERLPEESRGKVLQVDLKAQGVADLGEMRVRGFGHPYVNPGLELFFGDQPMQLARWPNRGMVQIGRVLDPGSVPREGDFSNRGGKFTYDYDRPTRWKQADNIWLSGLFAYGFADDTIRVQSIDIANKTIAMAQPHVYGVKTGRPWHAYYVLNLPEEIDQPGEWYLDRKSGILYFWPPSPIEKAKVSVSLLEAPMVAMEGASFVTLRGLMFEVTRGIGIYIERGTGNLVAGCALRNIGVVAVCVGQGAKPDPKGWGGWAITLEAEKGRVVTVEPASRELGDYASYLYANSVWDRKAGTNHGIVGCDIYNTGAGGIVLGGGDRRKLAPAGNYVLNCHIHHFNRLDRSYRPAVHVDGVGNRVAHCLIHDTPHGAIFLHGNDHLIELNEFHHACLLADDMGVLYMGRDPSEQGNVVRHNFFHHNGGSKGGTCCVYLDDGSCGTAILGNVFYKNMGSAVWINGGHDHIFRNSVFIESSASIGQGMDNKQWVGFVRDPLQALRLRKALDVTQPPYVTRYPKLASIFDPDPNLRRSNEVRANVSFRSGEFGAGRNEVKDNLVTQEDPGFVDAAKMNFELKPDSIVLTKVPGFQRIPFEEIGLHKDEHRRVVPMRGAAEPGAARPVRDPKTREFTVTFGKMSPYDALPGQGGWEPFGPGPLVAVGQGARTEGHDPGTVAAAAGADSWAAVWHGMILDPAKDIVLQMDARLPAPLGASFFELYLNRGQVHEGTAFGVALLGGAEDGVKDAIGTRQDSAGPRVLATERLTPGHWVRLRLVIPANSQRGRLLALDLMAGEKEFRALTFAGGARGAVLTRGGKWAPELGNLDALVLRLGGGAQCANIVVQNPGEQSNRGGAELRQ